MADNERDAELEYIDEDVKAKLRGQGAANIMEAIRNTIGDTEAEALGQRVAAGVADPLTAIMAKPVEARTRADWGDLYGAGRVDYEAIPDDIRRQMDLRS